MAAKCVAIGIVGTDIGLPAPTWAVRKYMAPVQFFYQRIGGDVFKFDRSSCDFRVASISAVIPRG